jgi:chemotaxis protein methyltransferase CheR
MGIEEFRLLRDLVCDYSGIYLDESQLTRVQRRLRPRLAVLELKDFSDYYRHLKFHHQAGDELERIVEILANNETYFFREEYQLKAFAEEILPEIHRHQAHRRHLHIWSAGCSSGEEAYTLAILVLESGLFAGWDVRIFGCDISRKVINKARRGVFGSSSFRFTDAAFGARIQETYFQKAEHGLQVIPALRKMVNFSRTNLMDRDGLAFVSNVDVIVCRNVLIYFPQDVRLDVVDMFYGKIRPGGYLLLGHSENLLNISTSFEYIRLSTDLVYRRPPMDGPWGPETKQGRKSSNR